MDTDSFKDIRTMHLAFFLKNPGSRKMLGKIIAVDDWVIFDLSKFAILPWLYGTSGICCL